MQGILLQTIAVDERQASSILQALQGTGVGFTISLSVWWRTGVLRCGILYYYYYYLFSI
jgi:hypothetical protein